MIRKFKKSLHSSVEEMLIKQFEFTLKQIEPLNDTEFYHSNIDIILLDQNKTIHLFYNKEFLESMNEKITYDENPTEDMLIDLSTELANLLVGRAKVISAEKNVLFSIKTPFYIGKDILLNSNNITTLSYKINDTMAMFIQYIE